MRVLLISANRLRPSPSHPWNPVQPLGAAYVAAALRRAGHEARLLDLCFAEPMEESVRGAVARFAPECVGVSIRNVDLMAYFNPFSFAGEVERIVSACRGATAAPIVLGGSGFSVMPRELLGLTGAGLGVVGEGEGAFPALLERLAGGGDPGEVPGVVRMGDGIYRAPRSPGRLDDLAANVRPARDLIDGRRYADAGATANVQTKRGCPFGCVYCTYPLIEGTAVRARPAADVADELEELCARDGVRSAYIVDSQFNYPPEHARAVCEELIDRRERVRLRWTCMVNPAFLNEELALLMRVARCAGVDLSLESGSDRVLAGLGKNYSVAEVTRAIDALEGARLPYAVWILLGGPGETARTVGETLDFLERVGARDVLFAVGVRICPGTKIEQTALAEGRLAADASLLEPRFYLAMDPLEIVALVRARLAAHPGWRIAALTAPPAQEADS